MESEEQQTYEDGPKKDEKISLSQMRAGTYRHTRLDPKTGEMAGVLQENKSIIAYAKSDRYLLVHYYAN